MEESRAKEIAYDYVKKNLHDTPLIESGDGSLDSEDGTCSAYLIRMTFVPQEQADINCKFRATWIAYFHVDYSEPPDSDWAGSCAAHGRASMYIDAETEEIWDKSLYGNRKLTAEEKLSARKERRKARKNKGLRE
jgi:hypothetical protein